MMSFRSCLLVNRLRRWMAAAWVTVAFALLGMAQDKPTSSEPPSNSDSMVSSLEEVQKDFSEHVKMEEKLTYRYKELDTKLKQTEESLRKINAQGMQSQLASMQSVLQSVQLNSRLQMLSSAGVTNNSPQSTQLLNIAQQDLLYRRLEQDMKSALLGEQLRQLDADAQSVIRQRFDAIQQAIQLQQDWVQWYQTGSGFYQRYWPLSDPEAQWSRSEVDSALAVLEKRDDKDLAAKLTAANLFHRSERYSDALVLIEEILKQESPLKGVAMMAKAKVLSSLDKDKEAKQSLQAAIKLDKANPYLRWIRAEIAASEDQASIAETEWRFLTTVKSMELQARRSLALQYAKKARKSPGEGSKAIKEAKTAMGLETVPTWYSHYVMGIALASGRKIDFAIESMEKAESMAEGEQKERCEKAKTEIEAAKE
jgi:hypothetical protein